MTLSEIRRRLEELGVHPSKSLGQNFLHDGNHARWIVDQLEPGPGDHLVEIGPGLGALTELAIPRFASATLLEKDRRLAAFLRDRFASETVEVRNEDALEFDRRQLFPRMPVKLLGNLPYNISSPALFHYTAEPSPIARAVFTVQREFAERLAAKARTKDYGALTLIVQRRWRVECLRLLPPTVFFPAPNVESATMVLTLRAEGEVPECDGARFNSLVKRGFSQRRKQLRKMLAPLPVPWGELAAGLQINETVRAEELSLEQWIALTNLLSPEPPKPAQDVHGEFFDVVDENDRVLRRAPRLEVHTERLWHRAVHVFVFNSAGELFLQKRSRWKDAHPSKWDSSASGHVESGGSYDETAPRELQEELGVTAEIELLARIEACRNTGWEFVQLYRAQHNGPFALARSEIECGAFFPLPLLIEWIEKRPQDFATGFLECFAIFRNRERTS